MTEHINKAKLIEFLEGLADEQAQIDSWVKGTKFYPDLTELLSCIFDDANVGCAIDEGSLINQVPKAAAEILNELYKYMSNRQILYMPHDQLAVSPQMAEIRHLARETLALLRADTKDQ